MTSAHWPGRSRSIVPRKGVLLLVVLCLLVLFLILGMTFLVVASQYRRSTIHLVGDVVDDSAGKRLLDSALLQVLRDTNDASSSILRNSLLLDKYGRPGLKARVCRVFPHDGALRFDSNELGNLGIDSNDVVALDIETAEPPYGSFQHPPDSWMGREVTATFSSTGVYTSRVLRSLPHAANFEDRLIDRIYCIVFRDQARIVSPEAGCEVNRGHCMSSFRLDPQVAQRLRTVQSSLSTQVRSSQPKFWVELAMMLCPRLVVGTWMSPT